MGCPAVASPVGAFPVVSIWEICLEGCLAVAVAARRVVGAPTSRPA